MIRYLSALRGFHWHVKLLIIVCIVNAFSFPWPRTLNLPEMLIAVLLLAAFLKGYLLVLAKPNFSYLYVLLLAILTLNGVISNSLDDVVRDVIPFLYLSLPIAFYYYFEKSRDLCDADEAEQDKIIFRFLLSISAIGLIYSLRAIWPFIHSLGMDFTMIYQSQLNPHTDYIFLDPALIFGSSFLALYGIGLLNGKNIYSGAVLITISLLIILAPFMASMRAPVFIYLMLIALAVMLNFRYKSLLLLPLLLLFMNEFYALAENLLVKQSEVGANGKIEEFVSIINYMRAQPFFNLMFGEGFGGTYYSTVLNADVRFTHNVFSYALFKGGVLLLVITLVLFVSVIWTSLQAIYQFLQLKNMLAFSALVAFLSSFLVSSLLQPGYKTLDFALLFIVYIYFVFLRSAAKRPYRAINENINNF